MIGIAAALALSMSASAHADSTRCSRLRDTVGVWRPPCTVPFPDTQPQRRHAIEYSDWYARRLTIHRIGSYTMLPLFGAEYVLGDRLLRQGDESGLKTAHVMVASGIGALFTVNTITGVWNLWDAREDPAGRKRRTVHALTMLAADAGFGLTALVAGEAEESNASARVHRNVALGSFGIATVGTAMMWLWKE